MAVRAPFEKITLPPCRRLRSFITLSLAVRNIYQNSEHFRSRTTLTGFPTTDSLMESSTSTPSESQKGAPAANGAHSKDKKADESQQQSSSSQPSVLEENKDGVPAEKKEATLISDAIEAERKDRQENLKFFLDSFPVHEGLSKEELEGEYEAFLQLSDEERILYVRRYRDPVAAFMVHGKTEHEENLRYSVRPRSFKKSELLPEGFEFDREFIDVYESVNLHTYPEISAKLFKSLEDVFKDYELAHPVIPKKDNFSKMISRTLGGDTKLLLDSVLPGNNRRVLASSLLSMTAMNLMAKCSKFGEDAEGKALFEHSCNAAEKILQAQHDLLLAICAHNVRTAKEVIAGHAGMSVTPLGNNQVERQQQCFQQSDLASVQLSLEQQRTMLAAVRGGEKRQRPQGFGSGQNKRARYSRGGFRGRGNVRGNFRGRGHGRPFRGRGFGKGQARNPSQ